MSLVEYFSRKGPTLSFTHAAADSSSTDRDSPTTVLPTISCRSLNRCSQPALATKLSYPIMHAKSLAFLCKISPLTVMFVALAFKNHLNTASSTGWNAAVRSFFLLPFTPLVTALVIASRLARMVDNVLSAMPKSCATRDFFVPDSTAFMIAAFCSNEIVFRFRFPDS